MSGILCVWANLPKGTTKWYENEYVPDMCSLNALHALHSEKTSNGMEAEPVGKLDAPWDLFTVYEMSQTRIATEGLYDKRNHPSDDLLAGALKGVRFDTRTYREIKRWQAEDWNGGKTCDSLGGVTNLTTIVRYCEHRKFFSNGVEHLPRCGERCAPILYNCSWPYDIWVT